MSNTHTEFNVIKRTLSDGSTVFNVRGPVGMRRDGDHTLEIGCENQARAETLAAELNASAWIELEDAR